MKPFAIYFPQFYATPLNNKAWGHGFTDWSLVASANVRRSESQRRAPARGFYDGGSTGLHLEQIEAMRASGLAGTALYHYWFYDNQQLDAFERTLLSTPTTFPWFLVWASENWTRRWVGDPTTMLSLADRPESAQIASHCDHLARCFEHAGYWRLDGKPLFVWYHLDHFKDPAALIERYREALLRRGVSVAFGHFVKSAGDAAWSAATDVSYLFEPRLFFNVQRARGTTAKSVLDRVRQVLGDGAAMRLIQMADRVQQRGSSYAASDYLDYLQGPARRRFIDSLRGQVQEVLSPGWNNMPRYGARFTALEDLPADDFARLVRGACAHPELPPLINAWNEWSENAAIEPCAYLGSRYVDALRAAARANDDA